MESEVYWEILTVIGVR